MIHFRVTPCQPRPRALFPGIINAVYKTLEGELEYSDTNAEVTY